MLKITEWFRRHERAISAGSIVLAFVIDAFTLERIDFYLTYSLILFYLAILAGGIVIINLRENGRAKWFGDNLYPWLFVIMQFSLGGLFGRFFIYYSRSGSFAASWPFLVGLLLLLIGNEFAKKHYTRLLLQINFFSINLLLFFVLFTPIVVGFMGPIVFLGSVALAWIVSALFLRFLRYILPDHIIPKEPLIVWTRGLIFGTIIVFYFTNIIPAIPLAIRTGGVYHEVVRTGDVYTAQGEQDPWYSFFKKYKVIHLTAGSEVYVYSAIFAPTNFGASVVHQWQNYNKETRTWENVNAITFPIVGGADEGYRGYTVKTNPAPGIWRVSIETAGGQIIGRIGFEVVRVSSTPPLKEEHL